jgi:hypothetical protein
MRDIKQLRYGVPVPEEFLQSLSYVCYEALAEDEQKLLNDLQTLLQEVQTLSSQLGTVKLGVVERFPLVKVVGLKRRRRPAGCAIIESGSRTVLISREVLRDPVKAYTALHHELLHHIEDKGDEDPDFQAAIADFYSKIPDYILRLTGSGVEGQEE